MRTAVVLLIVLVTMVLSNTAALSQTEEPSARLTPEEFPILAWSFTTSCQTPPDLDTFQDIRE